VASAAEVVVAGQGVGMEELEGQKKPAGQAFAARCGQK
jgi:hypothetical protein